MNLLSEKSNLVMPVRLYLRIAILPRKSNFVQTDFFGDKDHP